MATMGRPPQRRSTSPSTARTTMTSVLHAVLLSRVPAFTSMPSPRTCSPPRPATPPSDAAQEADDVLGRRERPRHPRPEVAGVGDHGDPRDSGGGVAAEERQ